MVDFFVFSTSFFRSEIGTEKRPVFWFEKMERCSVTQRPWNDGSSVLGSKIWDDFVAQESPKLPTRGYDCKILHNIQVLKKCQRRPKVSMEDVQKKMSDW